MIHHKYTDFHSCTREEWDSWIKSGKSRLFTFLPIVKVNNRLYSRKSLKDFLIERDYKYDLYFPYVTDNFIVEDWDFRETNWDYWNLLAKEDESFWGRLLDRIFKQPQTYWASVSSLSVAQISTSYSTRSIVGSSATPNWIMRFRDLRCLQDTHGIYNYPSELLLRTSMTESLLDIERLSEVIR